jgi:Zn-dependent protease with chaperone function
MAQPGAVVEQSGSMPRMCSDGSCVLFGIKTSSLMCPDCGKDTEVSFDVTERRAEYESIASTPSEPAQDSTEGIQVETAVDVVYLTANSDKEVKRGKKIFSKLFQAWYFYGIPIMCAWLAIADHDRVVFTVGTVLGLQLAYIHFRGQRFVGPVIDDPVTKSRVSPPLIELCAAAGVTVPRVCVRRTAIPGAVVLQNKLPTLWLTPDLVEVADDAELRAIIAHEVIHLRNGDLALAQRRRAAMVLTLMGLGFALIYLMGMNSWLPVAMLYAFVMPSMRLLAMIMGFSARQQETRADLEGAVLANDREAMIRGLTLVYGIARDIRRTIFGPKAFRWLLAPYSLPSTTHPPLKKRVAALQGMSVPATLAEAGGHGDDPVKSKRFGVVGRLVFLAAAVAVVLVVHHLTAKPTISPNLESPGGAHYMTLDHLGLSDSLMSFGPFTPSQHHDVFITKTQAVDSAESSESEHPENGITMTVAEGNVSNGGYLVFPTPGAPEWQPAYIVVFFGPKISTNGAEDVVIINAYNGTILNSFIN